MSQELPSHLPLDPTRALPAPLDLNPKIIFELAARVDRPEVIAERYGLDQDFLNALLDTPRVKQLVREKQSELDKAGYSLAVKAKLCFEDLLGDIYIKAKKHDATLSGVLEAAKFMRQVAGLDKTDVAHEAKFSISINIGGNRTVLTATQTPTDVIEAEEALPPKPAFLSGVRTFGNPLAYVEPT